MEYIVDPKLKDFDFVDPEALEAKMEKLQDRRGEIKLVEIYYRKNKAYRPPFNRGGYIRMKVLFSSGEVERYYLTERRNPIYTDHISHHQWRNS